MVTKTRTDVQKRNLLSTETTIYCNGVGGTDVRVSEVERPVYHNSKSWSRTSNYHELIKAKAALPDLPFSLTDWQQDFGITKYSRRGGEPCEGNPWSVKRYLATQQSSYAGSFGPPVESFRSTDESLKSTLLGKAKGAEWSAPVFFGEARETLTMVLGTAKKLASAYSSIRKGRLGDAYILITGHGPSKRRASKFNSEFGRRPREASANAWLEMQYGWLPLLGDVQNAAKQIAEFDLQDEGLIKNQGRVTASNSWVYPSSEEIVWDVSRGVIATEVKTVTETRKMVWKFTTTGMNDLGSLGLLNPLSVAWELVPLSFVVDWMLPIGDYLAGLDVPLRFKHAGGTTGIRQQVVSTVANMRFNTPDPDASVSGSYSFRRVEVRRDPLDGVPTLGLNDVFFNPNMGVKRWFSGMALASQRFKR